MFSQLKSREYSINNVISRSFILASVAVLAIAIMGAVIFNNHSLQVVRNKNIQKTHEILSDFLIPAIVISDTTEVHRALSLISDVNQIYSVINSNGDVYLSDYSNLDLIQTIYQYKNAQPRCDDIKEHYQMYNGHKYWINCSPLISDLSGQNKQVGILISFSQSSWLWFASFTIFFLGIAVISLLLISIWFRRVLHKRLLKPLIALGSQIVVATRSPLDSKVQFDSQERLPTEINEIKESFHQLLTNFKIEYLQRTKFEKEMAAFELAARVAHDIRSPLAAMEMNLKTLSKDISKEKIVILKEAIQGLRDIANNLLERYHSQTDDLPFNKNTSFSNEYSQTIRPSLIHSMIEDVISQKRHEWKKLPCEIELDIEARCHAIWLNLTPNHFKRMLSNLLNNAYESMDIKRKIRLKLYHLNDYLRLQIDDNGSGIPDDKLVFVLNGVSLKHAGKGLGLTGAIAYMQEIGGQLELASCYGKGTQVTLTFKCQIEPSWLPNKINLNSCSTLVVLDDDSSIHALWRQRLLGHKIKVEYFSCYDEAVNWALNNELSLSSTIFLLDYELSDGSANGLQFIEKFNLRSNSYLVTSHAEEQFIQEAAMKHGFWLIPKSLAFDVRIE